MNLMEILLILTILAVAAGTAIERTPEGIRLSGTRARTLLVQAGSHVRGRYSKAVAKRADDKIAQWSAVGVLGDRAVGINATTWGDAPRGPRELSYWRSALDCDANEATGWRSLSPDLDRWLKWRAAGVDVEDARKWFYIDDSVPAERASAWNVAGFDPVVAITWLRQNYSVDDALKLSYDGLLTYEDATELSLVGRLAVLNVSELPINDWIGSGFRGRIREIVEWVALNFSANEAKEWRAAVGTATASASWRNLGFQPHTAAAWLQHGCSGEQARKFLAAGVVADPADSITPSTNVSISNLKRWKLNHELESFWADQQVERVCEWLHAGFTDAEEVAAWIGLGLSPRVATSWKNVARLSHDVAREWIHEGISPHTASEWKHATSLPTLARKWMSNGFSAHECKSWSDALGNIDPDDARAWRDGGFTIATAHDWAGSDCSPAVAGSLKKVGLEPNEAKDWRDWWSEPNRIQDWRKAGFDSSAVAAPWFNSEFSPELAIEWSAIEGIAPQDAAEWRRCGFGPGAAAAWISNNFTPQRAKAWHDSGCKDPLTVRTLNQLLPAGRTSDDVLVTISDAAGWIAGGTSQDIIRERILHRYPPVGGPIGLEPRHRPSQPT